jgi:hypothetical protein
MFTCSTERLSVFTICHRSNQFCPNFVQLLRTSRTKSKSLGTNTETLLDANMEVGLEVNPEEAKYILMPRSQNTGQKHCVKIQKQVL